MTLTNEYIAGFFDGEGCLTFKKSKTEKMIPVLFIGQSGEKGKEILIEIQKFLAMGKIYQLKYNVKRYAKNTAWQLSIFRKEDIKKFKELVGCHCRIKDFNRIF